jgi:hypothetical protein
VPAWVRDHYCPAKGILPTAKAFLC